ncbi:MAG: IS110 family transposase [Firmicutes bacterium]|nr:IS110 family transposase [Bacillota bacterium]
MLSIGVDHHSTSSHLTICDQEGSVVLSKRIPSNREELARIISRYDEPKQAVLEAGYNWGRMYDWLDELVDEVFLAHPQKLRAIAEARIKNDKIDSEILAQLLRSNLIPPAFAFSRENRAVKRVLRQRMFLVKLRTMLKNRIHALLMQHEIEKPKLTDLFGTRGMAWLQALELPYPDDAIFREDLVLLHEVTSRIGNTESLLEEIARKDPVVFRLRSIPGIGKYFSILIRYEVEDMSRFPTPKKFASYAGLIPSTHSSGERTYHGRITKQGNKYLRWALVEAVTGAIRVSPQLRTFYEKLKKRKGVKEAQIATARKLAEIIWHVWNEDRLYEIR